MDAIEAASSSTVSAPTRLASPRCFVLDPVIDKQSALIEAGAHKLDAFGNPVQRRIKGIRTVDTDLMHRRLAPFWRIRCTSHFEYSRTVSHTIQPSAEDVDRITINGTTYLIQSGKKGRHITFDVSEHCVTQKDVTEVVDGYGPTQSTKLGTKKALDELIAKSGRPPREVVDFRSFFERLLIDEKRLFDDDVKTTIVLPNQTANSVVSQVMKQVLVELGAEELHKWLLTVEHIDLYFRPTYVFRFDASNDRGELVERKLEDLDAIKGHWTNLDAVEYPTSGVPWDKVLLLTAEAAKGVVRELGGPFGGAVISVVDSVQKYGPDIIESMRADPPS